MTSMTAGHDAQVDLELAKIVYPDARARLTRRNGVDGVRVRKKGLITEFTFAPTRDWSDLGTAARRIGYCVRIETWDCAVIARQIVEAHRDNN